MKRKPAAILIMALMILLAVPGSEELQAQQKKSLLELAVHRGKVRSTINPGEYTYIHFQG